MDSKDTNQVVYTAVPTSEHDVKFIKGQEPPPYVHVPGDEEAMLRETHEEGASAGGLCLGSILSMLFCFWPAALVSLVFSMKARYSDSDRAQRYLRIAKRWLWVSFIVGTIMIVVASAVQLAMMGHMAKKAYKGTLKGYVAGSYDGEVKGSADAQLMLVNGQSIKFPELIPGQVNVFDISSPFWQQIQGSESVKGAARVVGYSFGFVDGYKKGFCSTENADCNGVNMAMLSDYVECPHMKEKMEHWRAKYAAKLAKAQGEEQEGEVAPEEEKFEEEREHEHEHMKHHMDGMKKGHHHQ